MSATKRLPKKAVTPKLIVSVGTRLFYRAICFQHPIEYEAARHDPNIWAALRRRCERGATWGGKHAGAAFAQAAMGNYKKDNCQGLFQAYVDAVYELRRQAKAASGRPRMAGKTEAEGDMD
jgi:hypothetical protein